MKLLLTILALSCAILAVSSQDEVNPKKVESRGSVIPTRFRRWGEYFSQSWDQIANFTKETAEKIGENKIVQAGVEKAKEFTNSTKETIGDIGEKIAGNKFVQAGVEKAKEFTNSTREKIGDIREKIAENEFVQAGVEKAKEITNSTKEAIGKIAADENVQNGFKKGEELTGSAIEAAKEFGKTIEKAVHQKEE